MFKYLRYCILFLSPSSQVISQIFNFFVLLQTLHSLSLQKFNTQEIQFTSIVYGDTEVQYNTRYFQYHLNNILSQSCTVLG